ncbi:MAG TPA: hypothetical protein VH640_00635 [Bryobacteraceae bacterium]|jgi:hypothetical protein
MSSITLTLPDELVERLRNNEDRLAEILELGLRERTAEEQSRFEGAAEVLEFLAGLPEPAEILKLRPSERLACRIAQLLETSRERKLSAQEEEEWERYEFLEHLVRIAKAKASLKVNAQSLDNA